MATLLGATARNVVLQPGWHYLPSTCCAASISHPTRSVLREPSGGQVPLIARDRWSLYIFAGTRRGEAVSVRAACGVRCGWRLARMSRGIAAVQPAVTYIPSALCSPSALSPLADTSLRRTRRAGGAGLRPGMRTDGQRPGITQAAPQRLGGPRRRRRACVHAAATRCK